MEKKGPSQKWCLSCANQAKLFDRSKEKPERICENCGDVYYQCNKSQKICSKTCRDKYKNLRINENWTNRKEKPKSHKSFSFGTL